MPASGRAALAFLLLALASALGCATPCEKIATAHAEFAARAEPTSRADMTLSVPLRTLETLARPELEKLGSHTLDLPEIAGMSLGKVVIALESMKLHPVRDGKLGVSFGLRISQGKQRLMSAQLDTQLRTRIDPARRRVDLVLDAADISGIRARLDAGAERQLADFIYRQLPSGLRQFTSRDQIASLAGSAAERLLADSVEHFRKREAKRLGELAHFRFDLPDLPIRAVTLRAAKGDYLELEMFSDLPRSAGIALPAGRVPGVGDDALQLVVSGPAAAEFANRAMAEGTIPRRWNLEGEPDEDGPLIADLEWRAGERPLKLHLWKLAKDCAHVVIGATARIAVDQRHLVLSTSDARVEEVDGAFKVRAAIWFSGLGRRSFAHVERMASELSFDLGGRQMRGRIQSARVSGSDLVIGLRLDAR